MDLFGNYLQYMLLYYKYFLLNYLIKLKQGIYFNLIENLIKI